MLAKKPGNRLTEYTPDYVVFDLETTGISCHHDEVIEISAVKVRNGKVVDEFTTLVNPCRPIPYQASQVNHIYDDMVRNCPTFECALKHFLEFAGNAVLVGHNINSFDMKFIRRDAEKYWGQTIGNDFIDTFLMARQKLPQLNHYRLVDLAEHYGISSDGAHRALADCRMNQKVFEFLGKESKAKTEGLPTCPKCGELLKKRNGRYGEFWGCTGYPLCRFTKNL